MIKAALSAAIGVIVVSGVVDASSFHADATEAAFLQFETGIATHVKHLTADVDPWLAQREDELLDLQKKEKELDDIYTSQRFYARPTPEGKAAIEKAKLDREAAWQKVNAKRREINAYKEKNPPAVFAQLSTGKVAKKVAKKAATTKDPKAAALAKELKVLQAAAQQADEVYQRELQAQKTATPEKATIAKKLAVVKQKKAAVTKQIKQYKAKKSAKAATAGVPGAAAAPKAVVRAPKPVVAKAKTAGKPKKVVKGKRGTKTKKNAKKAAAEK